MFNPNRLRLARRRRKLSSKQLAERIGVSTVTLSRLERAYNEPDPTTIDALTSALGFPKTFFFGDDVDELPADAASFRSLTAMTAKEREAALAAGELAYMFSDWVAARFNLPQPDLIDLSREREPTVAARVLRDQWGLGERPIGNMIKLLEARGVRVFSLAENTRNVDAFSCWRDQTPYIFLNTFKSAEHSRFDAAHELGHLILHKHGGPQQGKLAEAEANAFASALLMPRADVLAHISFVTSINQLIRLKKRWGVSLIAVTYRLHKLGILTDWQYRQFCIQINKRGFRTNEPEPMAREQSVVWQKVFRQLWSTRVTKDDVAQELGVPVSELENLVFGLVASPIPHPNMQPGRAGKPRLKAI